MFQMVIQLPEYGKQLRNILILIKGKIYIIILLLKRYFISKIINNDLIITFYLKQLGVCNNSYTVIIWNSDTFTILFAHDKTLKKVFKSLM